MPKRPERRVSPTSDRRRSPRGGRRFTDYGWSAPPPVVACAGCLAGTADLLQTADARFTVRYRCRDCGHEFDRMAGL